MMTDWPALIVHADMDAFYAAVEQLDDPSLRGKPVLVGPKSDRGVVLTASYEARPYGITSAMPVAEARRRCPDAIIVPPRFQRYEDISRQVMDVLGNFSPALEPLSLDEAFLDMSGAEHIFGPPDVMGQKIKKAVREATQLNISVGISGTKFVAKVASAFGKPDGLTIIRPDQAVAWLAPLPVDRLWGVGKKTTPKLIALGLKTIGDVAVSDESDLRRRLGSLGSHIYRLAHAIDSRHVNRGRAAKSIGSDRTLSHDVCRRADIELHLRRAAERIARRVRTKNYVAHGIRVRLKTNTFKMLSRQRHLVRPEDTADAFFAVSMSLLDEFDHPGPFRLVGMAAFDLDWREQPVQLDFFENRRRRALEKAVDHLIERFGKGVILRARDLGQGGTIINDGMNLDFLDYRDRERVGTPR